MLPRVFPPQSCVNRRNFVVSDLHKSFPLLNVLQIIYFRNIDYVVSLE